MKLPGPGSLACMAIALALACGGCDRPQPDAAAPLVSPPEMALVGAVLLDGLGDHTFPVTSRHPEVQRWFD